MSKTPPVDPLPEFADFFHQSPACLALFEPQEPFRVMFHNQAFQNVLDEPFRSSGVVGKTIPEFASNPEKVLALYQKVAVTRESISIERYRYDGLERGPTWWNWSLTPVRKDGVTSSLALTSFEVTETVRAQERLQAEVDARCDAEALLAGEQELFQRIVDSIPVMITMYDPDANLLFVNKEFERLAGWTAEEARAEPTFERCYPDPEYREEVAHFMAHGSGWKDIRMSTRDGQMLETSWSNVRLSDNRQVGIGLDFTDRKAAEVELRDSQAELALERAFLEAVIEAAPVGISVARDPQGKPPIVNREARRMMGVSELKGGLERYLELPLHDEEGNRYTFDNLAIIEALHHGRDTTEREVIFDTASGFRRWLVNGRPLRNQANEIVAAITSFIDVEDSRRAEEAQELLVDELNHRVKNTLAIVQSIASQSFRDMSDPKDAQAKFRARLRALAAAHDLLTKGNWADATLSEIIKTSLFACGIMDDDARNVEFSIDTEERLSPKMAVSLSMALHELATNAIKHGALSSGSGQLSVRCSDSTSGPNQVLIEWEETHAGVSLKDYRSGFGMKLIRGTVENEMNGDLDLRFTAEGLKCVIVLPRAPLGGQG